MVHDKWSLQRGRDLNPQPLGRFSSPLPLDHGVLPFCFLTFYLSIFFFGSGKLISFHFILLKLDSISQLSSNFASMLLIQMNGK
jgi:hypothetical protein